MGNLFLPDGHGDYRQMVQKLEVPPIEVPYHLKDDLIVNPKMEPYFFQSVQKALDMSLNDPRTRLRELTVRAVKERIELCYTAVVTMRYDLKFPLKKCFDLLPAALMETLLGGLRLDEQMAHEGRDPKWWKGQGGAGVSSVGAEDITPEGAEHMEVKEEPDE